MKKSLLLSKGFRTDEDVAADIFKDCCLRYPDFAEFDHTPETYLEANDCGASIAAFARYSALWLSKINRSKASSGYIIQELMNAATEITFPELHYAVAIELLLNAEAYRKRKDASTAERYMTEAVEMMWWYLECIRHRAVMVCAEFAEIIAWLRAQAVDAGELYDSHHNNEPDPVNTVMNALAACLIARELEGKCGGILRDPVCDGILMPRTDIPAGVILAAEWYAKALTIDEPSVGKFVPEFGWQKFRQQNPEAVERSKRL